jgi:hypothetical protein
MLWDFYKKTFEILNLLYDNKIVFNIYYIILKF